MVLKGEVTAGLSLSVLWVAAFMITVGQVMPSIEAEHIPKAEVNWRCHEL